MYNLYKNGNVKLYKNKGDNILMDEKKLKILLRVLVLISVIILLTISIILPYMRNNKLIEKYIIEGTDATKNESAEVNQTEEVKAEATWDISKNQDKSVIAKWTASNQTLTISGTGEIKSYSYNEVDYRNSQYTELIKKAVISNGVTNIGYKTFKDCSNMQSISIANSVTNIASYAFERMY